MRLSAGTCATQRRPCVQTLLQRGRTERHTAAQGTGQLQVQRPVDHHQFHGSGRLRGAPQPASTRPQGTPLETKHSTHPKKKALVLFGQSRWVPAGRTDLTNPGTRRYRQQEMRAQCLQRSVIRGACLSGEQGSIETRTQNVQSGFGRAILSNPGTRKHQIIRCKILTAEVQAGRFGAHRSQTTEKFKAILTNPGTREQ